MSLDEMISEDNAVRVLDAFVDSINSKELGFKYAIPKTTGRKSYNPFLGHFCSLLSVNGVVVTSFYGLDHKLVRNH